MKPGRSSHLIFVLSLLGTCWLAMQAVHELGHVLGAIATGGRVVRVVLDPLEISRTDVAPNPQPSVVVWAGPIVGCALPLTAAAMLRRRRGTLLHRSLLFFAGFCLIANGTYIGMGAFDAVGDAETMLDTGSPRWLLAVFGIVAITIGAAVWHRLGSVTQFLRHPAAVTSRQALVTLVIAATLGVVELCIF